MMNFLPKDFGDWSIGITQHFQSHLREDIWSQMKANNSYKMQPLLSSGPIFSARESSGMFL
jgi:hypothetical protein